MISNLIFDAVEFTHARWGGGGARFRFPAGYGTGVEPVIGEDTGRGESPGHLQACLRPVFLPRCLGKEVCVLGGKRRGDGPGAWIEGLLS